MTDCPCAECTHDSVDYVILARYWTPKVWFRHVGTYEERNSCARTPDNEPRGELRNGTRRVPANELHGEL